ncbi:MULTISPECIES: NAD(P)/FAD-dependent oxidoreductase [unclassified Pseudomonas]|uniref:NAD(P)/FAD-dependent oxidoreductase n=1 Tax=unclassified Pseudomonas TaxID=196821 RepID=UPI000BDAC83E|nr:MULTISPECIES: NAD(P)/FAD-dependent oxidoreductase [unclassified Pseudomonas]PVZ20155.1 thioredoxin reductase [Pseudomonas sp. URIL14HWK12:I12]PVZ27221.1 thioredoxin reductase [Pseudomonas sp. URIL14HWK12:I10]PVZ38110.1 thioredoxin reductase [Pseudomonas sp. URIL14HWK12:I11]SNZ04530.1 Thioredoxin reductase [Pseudomonas sp. URIL14HWK12:I9]
MLYDVVIVGGSYAGVSAGLQLARARRKVLVVDAGLRRNRFARHSHGFLGQDGRDPADIAHDAQTQLRRYPTVDWLNGEATDASPCADGFAVTLSDARQYLGKRLILATGVVDQLPAIDGLAQQWGVNVFHCPYCHGYELGGGPIGVLATSELAMHHALMLPDWGATILFLNAAFEPDANQLASLKARGVRLERERVTAVGGQGADVTLASGRVVELKGLFTQPRIRMASPLAERLGCVFEEGPMGPFIKVDAQRATSVPGVFACGDAAIAAGNVAIAVGDGARTGGAVHASMMFAT